MRKDTDCRTCGEPLVLRDVDIHGGFQTYAVAAQGLPVLRCPNGHETKEAYDEFLVNLSEQLAFEDHLFTKRVGLFRRRDVCRACGAELNLNSVASQRTQVPMQHGDAPEYQLEITAPVVRCPECSTVQVPNRDEHHEGIHNALRDALDTAGIRYR